MVSVGNGGLPPPRPDQSYDPPPGGQAVAGQRSVVRARLVIIVGPGPPGSGLFAYSPAVAISDLKASVTATAGTDQPGNAIPAGGVFAYGLVSGTWIAAGVSNGALVFYTAPSEQGPWTQRSIIQELLGGSGLAIQTSTGDIDMLPAGNLVVNAGADFIVNVPSQLADTLITGSGTTTPLVVGGSGSNHPTLILNGASLTNVLRVFNTQASPNSPIALIEGAAAGDPALRIDVNADANSRFAVDTTGLVKWGNGTNAADTHLYRAAAGELAADSIAANLASNTAEVWNAPTFANGWANAATGTALQYRLVAAPYNCMQWTGRLTAPAGIVAGQAVITAIPAAYRPTHVQPVLAVDNTTGALVRFQMSNTGVLVYESGSAAGDIIDIQCGAGIVSLDA